MSDHFSDSESAIEMWIKCPYDKTHLLIKEDMLEHLETCRERYAKTMAAEGRPLPRLFCNKSGDHYVPKQELYLHKITCQDVGETQLGEPTKQEADSSSGGSFLDEHEGEQEEELEGASGQEVNDYVDVVSEDEDEDWAAIRAANAVGK